MAVAGLPINPGMTSGGALQGAASVVDPAVAAGLPVADLFAALLAQQLGQPAPAALPGIDLSKPDAAVAEPNLVDPGKVSAPASVLMELLPPKKGVSLQNSAKAEADVDAGVSSQPGVDAAAQAAQAVQSAQQLVAPAAVPIVAPVAHEVRESIGAPVTTEKPAERPISAMQGRLPGTPEIETPAASAAQTARQPVAAESASFAVAKADVSPEETAKFSLPQGAIERKMSSDAEQSSPATPGVATQSFVPPMPLQPSSQSAPVQASGSIPQAVGHSAWGEALGDRVVWMVSQQHQGVELHLNPPALGPLEVRLSMNDGQASLSFSTQHLPVKEAIESATPRLREMLGESGISLGSVSVNVGSFTQPQQQQSQQQAQFAQGRAAWAGVPAPADSSAPLSVSSVALHRNGMVDIFA